MIHNDGPGLPPDFGGQMPLNRTVALPSSTFWSPGQKRLLRRFFRQLYSFPSPTWPRPARRCGPVPGGTLDQGSQLPASGEPQAETTPAKAAHRDCAGNGILEARRRQVSTQSARDDPQLSDWGGFSKKGWLGQPLNRLHA